MQNPYSKRMWLRFSAVFILFSFAPFSPLMAYDGPPPPVETVATGDVESVRKAMSEYSREEVLDISYGRNYGITHAAIANEDNPDVLETVVEAGADVDDQDSDGRTPLHHAIDNNSAASVKILLRYKARLDLKNEAGLFPLSFCREVLATFPQHESCRIVIAAAP